MLDFNKDKNNCSGCSACYSVCPVHCISMKKDPMGFLYPEASDSCIKCGACEKVCPWVSENTIKDQTPEVYAFRTKNREIWHRSTSGGAFTELCKTWGDHKTKIYGAVWDGFEVHHKSVTGIENIAPLCKSKYLASYLDDTYIEVRRDLQEGNKVIFSGCPCQVDGLKNFLGKEYDNLLLIDLICHGQGSPKLFMNYISILSDFLGEKVLKYTFRAKGFVTAMGYTSQVETKKQTYYISYDPYNQLFLKQRGMRPSCVFNCKYKSQKRCSDFTIADCKGFERIFPKKDNMVFSYSTIICNTKKAKDIIRIFDPNNIIFKYELYDVIKFNPIFASIEKYDEKDYYSFIDDYLKNGNDAIVRWTSPIKYTYPPKINKLYRITPSLFWPVIGNIIKIIKSHGKCY